MRRHFWIAVVIVAALAAGWWFGRNTAPAHDSTAAKSAGVGTGKPGVNNRSDASKHAATRVQSSTTMSTTGASKPLPPPGTPLKQSFDELKARANAGDAEAAARLFRDMRKCQNFRRKSRSVPELAQMALNEKVAGASTDQLKSNDSLLGMVQDEFKFLRENAALCTGLPDEMGNAGLPVALQAAQLGDLAAINCYVGGNGESGVPAGLIDHPEWLSEYKENALPLANTAIEKGDWTMVSQLAWAYRGDFPSNLLTQVTGHDTAMAYRYLKLALLGAPAADNDEAARLLQNRLGRFAGEITADQKAAADAWAQNAYQTYFREKPKNPYYNSYKVCPSDK